MIESEGTQSKSLSELTPDNPITPINDAPAEKVFTQSELNEIVGREKHQAAAKARRDMEERQRSMGGMPQMSPEEIRETIIHEAEKRGREAAQQEMRQILDEQKQQFERQQANQVAHEIINKLNDTRSRYNDFDDVFKGIKLENYSDIVLLANQFGSSTGDIMYDLMKNPAKLANMLVLASRAPDKAYLAMAEMESSIKANQNARKEPSPPLSTIQPSNSGLDTEAQDISSLRRMKDFRA